jgi:Kelch motif
MQPTRYCRAIAGVLVALLLLAAADATAQPAPQPPTVGLAPACGALGTQITATGSGWGAATEIQVLWNPVEGASNAPLATTGVNRSNGTIRASFAVPPNFRPDNTVQFVGTPVEPGAQPIQVSQLFRIPCGAPAAPPGAPLTTTRPAAAGRWTSASLSVPRLRSQAAVVGSQVLFVGGLTDAPGPNVVDVYDSTSDQWSTASLSGRRPQHPPVVVVGSKVIIAGEDGIDIYDSSTATWTTATLPTRRPYGLVAATAGTKALFAGGQQAGESPTVDVYDAASGSWSTAALAEARDSPTTAVVDGKVVFAGGEISCRGCGPRVLAAVDVYHSPP